MQADERTDLQQDMIAMQCLAPVSIRLMRPTRKTPVRAAGSRGHARGRGPEPERRPDIDSLGDYAGSPPDGSRPSSAHCSMSFEGVAHGRNDPSPSSDQPGAP